MIQRQQSLWLLLSAIAGFLTFKFPFYTGQLKDGIYSELEAGSSFFLLLLTGASILLAVITIFLFKDRKLQLKLAIAGAVVSVLVLIIYISEVGKFAQGRLAFSGIFVFAMITGFLLGARGIWKDERLVKSLDKLR